MATGFAQKTKGLGYLLAYLTPALLPISYGLGHALGGLDAWAWFPIAFLFVLLPLADHLLGRDRSNPDESEVAGLEQQPYYRWLTLACLPLYLALMVWSCAVFAGPELGVIGKLGWLISQGVIGGVLAINVGHELIHKANRFEQWAGGALLASVSYGGFKIEHVRGHHVHVSTPMDASSARFGQDVYRFVWRGIPRNVRAAFALEAERLRRLGLSPWHWRNELWYWYGLSLSFALLLTWAFGLSGTLFFVAQSVWAFVSLEIINYIEHYGLERARLADGRYERTTHLHSWNSNFLLTNWMLFQLQRHSDHHANARRRYQALRHFDDSPQLPSGYAGMFLLALVPPLWFKVMNHRVPGRSPQG